MSTTKCNINCFSCCKTNGLSNIVFGNVEKPISNINCFGGNVEKRMVLATYVWKCCKTNGFSNIIFGNVIKPMVLATLHFEML